MQLHGRWWKKENLVMEVLEKLRFRELSRLLIKEYETGTIRSIRNRAHNGFIFCDKGQLHFTMNGKELVCNPQQVVLAPKGCDYDFVVESESHTFLMDFELSECAFEEMYSFPIRESESFYHDYLNMQKRVFGLVSYKLTNLSELYDVTARINSYGYHVKKYKIIEASEKYLEENL